MFTDKKVFDTVNYDRIASEIFKIAIANIQSRDNFQNGEDYFQHASEEYFKACGKFYVECAKEDLHNTCADIKKWVKIQSKYAKMSQEDVIKHFGYMI